MDHRGGATGKYMHHNEWPSFVFFCRKMRAGGGGQRVLRYIQYTSFCHTQFIIMIKIPHESCAKAFEKIGVIIIEAITTKKCKGDLYSRELSLGGQNNG